LVESFPRCLTTWGWVDQDYRTLYPDHLNLACVARTIPAALRGWEDAAFTRHDSRAFCIAPSQPLSQVAGHVQPVARGLPSLAFCASSTDRTCVDTPLLHPLSAGVACLCPLSGLGPAGTSRQVCNRLLPTQLVWFCLFIWPDKVPAYVSPALLLPSSRSSTAGWKQFAQFLWIFQSAARGSRTLLYSSMPQGKAMQGARGAMLPAQLRSTLRPGDPCGCRGAARVSHARAIFGGASLNAESLESRGHHRHPLCHPTSGRRQSGPGVAPCSPRFLQTILPLNRQPGMDSAGQKPAMVNFI